MWFSGSNYIDFANYSDEGVMLHEMGHTYGMMHEHQRCDRDQYVTVSGSDNNYNRECGDTYKAYTAEYDYDSIMNYFSPHVYATPQIPSAPFIRDGMTREQWLASGRAWSSYMPDNARLSPGDVQTLNMMRYHQ